MESPALRSDGQVSAILYHHPYSICSIMVRYTLAIRGAPKDASAAIVVEEQEVDIYHGAQLKEQYLCEVNSKGQVPVLAGAALHPAPITKSLDITMYVAELYSDLQPTAHKQHIARFLHDLHAINYFSLSFGAKPQHASAMKDAVLQRMNEPSTSQRYREALEYKLKIIETEKIGGVTPAQVDTEVERTRSFLSRVEQLLVPPSGPWLFGRAVPTALDAHLVAFLARLQDLERGELISPGMSAYRDAAMKTPEWRRVMNGRQTMYSG
jgi:glutathione S-transferase